MGWTRWWRIIGIAVGITGCAANFSTFSIHEPAVHRVRLGDRPEDVRRLLGAPQQRLPEERTVDGRLKVVWVYDAAAVSERSVSGRVRPTPVQPLAIATNQHTESLYGASYLIVFLDGRVSQIVERP